MALRELCGDLSFHYIFIVLISFLVSFLVVKEFSEKCPGDSFVPRRSSQEDHSE